MVFLEAQLQPLPLKVQPLAQWWPKTRNGISGSQAIENSCKTNKAKAENNPNNRRAIALLRTLLPQHLSLTEMTALLNEQGFVAPNGSKFQITQVKRLIDRISE